MQQASSDLAVVGISIFEFEVRGALQGLGVDEVGLLDQGDLGVPFAVHRLCDLDRQAGLELRILSHLNYIEALHRFVIFIDSSLSLLTMRKGNK
jgi:hypothetical protein